MSLYSACNLDRPFVSTALAWFSQSGALTPPSVCAVMLIAWARCTDERHVLFCLLHLHKVPDRPLPETRAGTFLTSQPLHVCVCVCACMYRTGASTVATSGRLTQKVSKEHKNDVRPCLPTAAAQFNTNAVFLFPPSDSDRFQRKRVDMGVYG